MFEKIKNWWYFSIFNFRGAFKDYRIIIEVLAMDNSIETLEKLKARFPRIIKRIEKKGETYILRTK